MLLHEAVDRAANQPAPPGVGEAVAGEPLNGGRFGRTVSRLVAAAWVWPAALTAALGLWQIGRPEMWQDELVTADVATRPVRRILVLLPSVDAVHGTYYLFMHFWIRLFGASAAAMRAPSVIAMVAAAVCVVLVGQRLFGRKAAVLGGLVFAVVPSVTRFSQEARSYALVVLSAALATLLLLRALERPGVLRWCAYGLCITALTLLNTVAVSILVGHLIGVVVQQWPQRNWRVLASFGAAALGGPVPALPVVILGMHQAERQLLWISHSGALHVWPQLFASTWMSCVVLALAVLAWFNTRRPVLFTTVVALVPPLVVWIASAGSLSYFFPKYLLFSLPAWAVLSGAGLAALRPRIAPPVGLILVAALAIPGQLAMRGSLSHSWYDYPNARPSQPLGYAEAARRITAGYQPGDGVIYQRSPWWWQMIDFGVAFYLPDNVRPRDVFESQPASATHDLIAVECPVSARCIGNEPRVWLVVSGNTQQPLAELSPDQQYALNANYTLVSVTYEPGLTVALLRHVH
jgi:mannosyltransferase